MAPAAVRLRARGAILRLHKSLLPKRGTMYYANRVHRHNFADDRSLSRFIFFHTTFPRKRKVHDLCGRLAFNVNIFRQIGHKRVDSCRAAGELELVFE